MKKILILFVLTSLCAITFISCSTSVNNGITFKNLASGDIHVNFRATLTTVKAGETVTLSNLPKGLFDYNTTDREQSRPVSVRLLFYSVRTYCQLKLRKTQESSTGEPRATAHSHAISSQ